MTAKIAALMPVYKLKQAVPQTFTHPFLHGCDMCTKLQLVWQFTAF